MNVERMLEEKGRDVRTILPSATVADAVDILTDNRIGALVVSADGVSIAGILSERDIVHGLNSRGAALLGTPVAEIMTTEVRSCTPEDESREVMALMTEFRFRHLPVVSDGKLCGIISIGDVVKSRLDEILNESELLKNYVMGIGQG
jgi:CBS domain-containing protein